MNENLKFLMECHEMGINVPDFKKLSDVPFSDLSMFSTQGLFQDEDKRFILNAMPDVKIPYRETEFQNYLDTFMTRTENFVPSQPYILQEFIEGSKFVASAVCKNGKVLVFHVSILLSKMQNG